MDTKKVIIYGTGLWGKLAITNVHKYKDIEIVGVADSYKTGEALGYPIIELEKGGYEDCSIVLAIGNTSALRLLYHKLKACRYKSIYRFLGKSGCFGDDFLSCECMKCGDDFLKECLYIGVHLVDFCNLNCKGCTHFSPLFEREIPNAEIEIRDVRLVKEIFGDIQMLDLMGGEPLLSPFIEEYIVECRKILPHSCIQLVTNGLLLLQMKETVIRCIKENNIVIVISEYEPTHRMIDAIITRLREYKIDYVLRNYDRKQTFNKPISITDKSVLPKHCISEGCTMVSNGKIARCPTLMYIHKFNEKFNQNLPTEGICDIEQFRGRREELLRLLDAKVPLCDYCVSNPIKWEQCTKNPQIEDFASLE